MGVPKRRQSKSRKSMRRSEWRKIAVPGLVECPHCHELVMTHRVCPACGFYKNQDVLAMNK